MAESAKRDASRRDSDQSGSLFRSTLRRFARFSLVGASGVVVQTMTLAILLRFAGMHYLLATALAVEASVLNNFVWHRRWTWADRPANRVAVTLFRFNATNGVLSLLGNLIVMFALVRGLGLEVHLANLVTISFCSLVNFAMADRLVFN